MDNNKARRVRQVSGIEEDGSIWTSSIWIDDPSGTHHLAPVDEYEVVKKEVWKMVVKFIYDDGCVCDRETECLRCRALAEIGGE